MKNGAIYGIYDKRADALISVNLFKHPAAAVRFYGDVASTPDTTVNKHPEDYDLVCICELDDDHTALSPSQHMVLTGEAWKASKTPPQGDDK